MEFPVWEEAIRASGGQFMDIDTLNRSINGFTIMAMNSMAGAHGRDEAIRVVRQAQPVMTRTGECEVCRSSVAEGMFAAGRPWVREQHRCRTTWVCAECAGRFRVPFNADPPIHCRACATRLSDAERQRPITASEIVSGGSDSFCVEHETRFNIQSGCARCEDDLRGVGRPEAVRCVACGERFNQDSRLPEGFCRRCASTEIQREREAERILNPPLVVEDDAGSVRVASICGRHNNSFWPPNNCSMCDAEDQPEPDALCHFHGEHFSSAAGEECPQCAAEEYAFRARNNPEPADIPPYSLKGRYCSTHEHLSMSHSDDDEATDGCRWCVIERFIGMTHDQFVAGLHVRRLGRQEGRELRAQGLTPARRITLG